MSSFFFFFFCGGGGVFVVVAVTGFGFLVAVGFSGWLWVCGVFFMFVFFFMGLCFFFSFCGFFIGFLLLVLVLGFFLMRRIEKGLLLALSVSS